MMGDDNIDQISHLIQQQFPDVYKDEGPQFIQFVKAFYEWLEQSGQAVGDSRSNLRNIDIDLAGNDFLAHFQKTYMASVPEVILGDKRFLQKHLLDLYRSKGSSEGLRLLFRLLYNEEIEIYIPSYDMLRISDGKWIEKRYIEIERTNGLCFQNQIILGRTSGATAIVEAHERRIIAGKQIELLYVSHIQGQFVPGELISYDGLGVLDWVRINGSVLSATVQSSSLDFDYGDLLMASNGSGLYLQGVVAKTQNIATGFIEFDLVHGGYGYSEDAVLSITSLGTGSGANIEFTIGNTSEYEYNLDAIAPYVDVDLDAANYDHGTSPVGMASANLTTTLADALAYDTKLVGEIVEITTTNPGDESYDADVVVSIVDPWTGSSNAMITGTAKHGSNLVSEIKIVSSGFGYVDGETIEFYQDANTSKTTSATISFGGVGIEPGYYENSDGWLNADKYIQDSYYYQEFSYEVRSTKVFSKYLAILKAIYHPMGNEPFGQPIVNFGPEEPSGFAYVEINDFEEISGTSSLSMAAANAE